MVQSLSLTEARIHNAGDIENAIVLCFIPYLTAKVELAKGGFTLQPTA